MSGHMEQKQNAVSVSFVIPCYRSERYIERVLDELYTQASQISLISSFETICIVDGSPDNVANVLERRASWDSRLVVVELSRNFGQPNAKMAGFRMAGGDVVVSLDDDGQCPVDKLEELISAVLEGADLAIASYPKKTQSAFKNAGSKINDLMSRWVMDKPEDLRFSNFFAFSSFVRDAIKSWDKPYPYLYGLVNQISGRIVNVAMEERERKEGSSGFTFKKSLSLWLNGFTGFSIKPLRISFLLAAFTCVAGLLCIVVSLLAEFSDLGLVASLVLFSCSLNLAILGLIGEYVGRIYMLVNGKPQFVVRRRTGR